MVDKGEIGDKGEIEDEREMEDEGGKMGDKEQQDGIFVEESNVPECPHPIQMLVKQMWRIDKIDSLDLIWLCARYYCNDLCLPDLLERATLHKHWWKWQASHHERDSSESRCCYWLYAGFSGCDTFLNYGYTRSFC